ncbi:hypothetical protein OESDEN_15422 [Oesophagostomum dentatum]|uniref:Uncharacterized protein n=1 Tax=Oesophagostomum dentatum TaxID=61180 RepID=A0A0B1SIV9_OESDE|nr:hypothetical protein OESDEN_15422 [Oesophagostomum dentatum]
MSKSLGLERARSAYSKIAKARCSVCKGHYTYALSSIKNEVVLSAADVEQFHSECSSGFHTELPPVHITPKCESDSLQDSEPLFNSNAMDPNSVNGSVKEEVKDFAEDAEEEDDQEAISNHSGDEDIEETLVAEYQHSDEDTEKGQIHFTSFSV